MNCRPKISATPTKRMPETDSTHIHQSHITQTLSELLVNYQIHDESNQTAHHTRAASNAAYCSGISCYSDPLSQTLGEVADTVVVNLKPNKSKQSTHREIHASAGSLVHTKLQITIASHTLTRAHTSGRPVCCRQNKAAASLIPKPNTQQLQRKAGRQEAIT